MSLSNSCLQRSLFLLTLNAEGFCVLSHVTNCFFFFSVECGFAAGIQIARLTVLVAHHVRPSQCVNSSSVWNRQKKGWLTDTQVTLRAEERRWDGLNYLDRHLYLDFIKFTVEFLLFRIKIRLIILNWTFFPIISVFEPTTSLPSVWSHNHHITFFLLLWIYGFFFCFYELLLKTSWWYYVLKEVRKLDMSRYRATTTTQALFHKTTSTTATHHILANHARPGLAWGRGLTFGCMIPSSW